MSTEKRKNILNASIFLSGGFFFLFILVLPGTIPAFIQIVRDADRFTSSFSAQWQWFWWAIFRFSFYLIPPAITAVSLWVGIRSLLAINK